VEHERVLGDKNGAAHMAVGVRVKMLSLTRGNRFLPHSGPRENDLRSWREPENSVSST